MFSSFQYFDFKHLSIGAICYLTTAALLCLLYLELDRPRYQVTPELQLYNEAQYWINYDFSNELQEKDVYILFNHVLTHVDLSDVSFKFECDVDSCLVSFTSDSAEGRRAAQKALYIMRNQTI